MTAQEERGEEKEGEEKVSKSVVGRRVEEWGDKEGKDEEWGNQGGEVLMEATTAMRTE